MVLCLRLRKFNRCPEWHAVGKDVTLMIAHMVWATRDDPIWFEPRGKPTAHSHKEAAADGTGSTPHEKSKCVLF